jgi:hypothetical protein
MNNQPLTSNKSVLFSKNLFLSFILLFSSFLFSQIDESLVIDSFEDYAEAPRETVYVHLNKTTYIKGEMIGFSAYVFDAASKELSFSTTNLYCVISDKDDKIVKSGLFLVKRGVVSNVFETDSLFTSGEYKFKAYTNWMRNFKEKNFFSQTLRVIDTDIEKEEAKTKNEVTLLDIQALPEGGHLLEGVSNTLGIIVKDQFGKGISDIEGSIIDDTNQNVGSFKLDSNGIGKTLITPLENKNYSISFNYGYKDYKSPISKAKSNGIALALKSTNDKIIVSLITNLKTLPNIHNKNYTLAIHNGAEIQAWEFNFNDTSLNKAFEKENLFPGVNVFTVFNSDNTPLLERVYFNHQNIKRNDVIVNYKRTRKDSLDISIKAPNLKKEQFSSLSVSLLPLETKSYNPDEGILSGVYLRPYLNGKVEKLESYFKVLTPKKQYELDNLMITQGWSSYKWGDIFSKAPDVAYSFEQGISYKATRSSKDKTQFLIQPLRDSPSVLFELDNNEKSFEGAALFPVGTDKLNVTEIKSASGKTKKPSLYFTFKPNSIPLLKTEDSYTKTLNKKAILADFNNDNVDLGEIQKLDEVQLSVKIERTRYESLKKLTRGTIDIFDDMKRNAYTDFATYIASKGFIVNENLARTSAGGQATPLLAIFNSRKNRLTGGLDSPLIFLDDVLLDGDLSILYNFKMDIVDYIEIDKGGASLGMRGSNGVIKIYTDPGVQLKQQNFRDILVVNFPFKFTTDKNYYTPQYKYYNTPFFNKYGTIGWSSNLKPDSNGHFNIRIRNSGTKSIKLFIEGITNDNIFISESKTLEFN